MKRIPVVLLLLALASPAPVRAADENAQTANELTYPVVFTRQENHNDNIYLMDVDGSLKQVTDHPRKDSTPMVSPDGRAMVFTSERVGWWSIWIMDLETREVVQLTDSPKSEYAPCWSPSGEEIAFVSTRDGNPEIYVMGRDGSDFRNVSRNPGNDNLPTWGHDGYIYYSSLSKGTLQATRVRPDGSGREVLTSTPGGKLMPQISPDGTRLLMYSDRDGNLDIYTMDLDGSNETRLTEDPLLDFRPRWSPDGKQILFERGNQQGDEHIYIMNADGSNQTRLTSTAYNYAPSFVTDCRWLCGEGKQD